MEHKTVISNRGTVHYWIHRNDNENAEFIIFTHGITADHTMFEKQIEHFSKDYSIITWDVPLHGESRPYNGFSYENNAKELKAILDSEVIDKVLLVGMSNGGYTSQEFAHRYPEMVKGFVAIDTTPFGLKYYSKWDKWIFSMFASSMKLFPEKKLRETMAKSSASSQYGYKLMKSMHDKLTKDEIIHLAGTAYNCLMKENKDVYFDFPVMILLGEHDNALKVDRYSERWSKETGYPLKIIKDAAHFSNADNPAEVNQVIHEFALSLS